MLDRLSSFTAWQFAGLGSWGSRHFSHAWRPTKSLGSYLCHHALLILSSTRGGWGTVMLNWPSDSESQSWTLLKTLKRTRCYSAGKKTVASKVSWIILQALAVHLNRPMEYCLYHRVPTPLLTKNPWLLQDFPEPPRKIFQDLIIAHECLNLTYWDHKF